jgi:hypothetical protein
MTTYLTDAYRDQPPPGNTRLVIEEELRRLKAQMWSDPSDTETRLRIAALQAALAELDRGAR